MKLRQSLQAFFKEQLFNWFKDSHRPLPWKGEKSPYLIWLSEIILQQTRVEQGLPYFEKFKAKYPNIEDLAAAAEDDILKLWEGLGYYSRARNLHATAKFIASELDGKFPDKHVDILALKGVGPYTAAAIASFAFDLPYAVVDGNVFRVLSRFFGIEEPIDTGKGKKLFTALAQELIDKEKPAQYNQAIMDFGATHCTPSNPLCDSCPLSDKCFALENEKIDSLPVKAKKIVRKNRFFHYLVFNFNGQVILQKRTGKDIWKHLYEFPLLELTKPIKGEQQIITSELWKHLAGQQEFSINQISKPFQQLLTHQKIVATFWEVSLKEQPFIEEDQFVVTERKNLRKFAFPKIIDWYLRDKSLYLKLL